MFLFVQCSDYVLSYCYHYCFHSTCDSYVLWIIIHHCSCYTGFHLCGPNNIRSAWCGSAATVDSKGTQWGILLASTILWQQQPQSQMLSDICQLCHGSLPSEFSLSELSLLLIHMSYFGICYGVYFCFWVLMWLPNSSVGAQLLCLLVMLCGTQGVHWVAASPTASSRESFILLIQLPPQPFHQSNGHTALGTQQKITWSFHLPYIVGRGLLFQVVLHPMTQLTPNLWWALNLVILVWWLAVRLIKSFAHLVGRVLHCLITHLPRFHLQGININPISTIIRACGILLFGPSHCRLWIWSWCYHHRFHNTQELDTSSDETYALPSSVPSWFLCLFSTISDNSRPQLVASIISCKLGYYFYDYHRQVKHQPVCSFVTLPVIQHHLDLGFFATW